MTTKNYVTLTSKDGSEHWKLAFTTNAMCAYEEETQKPFTSVAEVLQGAETGRLSMRVLRTILWAGLIEHQESATLREAGRAMDACGFQAVGQQIAAAVRLAFPEARETAKETAKETAGNAAAPVAATATGTS